jgi:hypothetical protein
MRQNVQQRNTEPVTLSSAGSTDHSPWDLRPCALGLWNEINDLPAPRAP